MHKILGAFLVIWIMASIGITVIAIGSVIVYVYYPCEAFKSGLLKEWRYEAPERCKG